MTPRISLRRCRKCPYYHGHCPLNDLDPCIMAPTEEERMRTRIGLVCTLIVAVICAAVLVFAGCSGSNPTEFAGNKHWSAVELLRQQHRDELTDFEKLTLAIALTESRFNPKADSGHGDSGLLQLRSIYIDEVNRLYGTEYTIDDAFDIECYVQHIASRYPILTGGQDTRIGVILEQPDVDGFFTVKNQWSDKEELCCVVSYHDAPSLYRGGLRMFCA